MLSIPVEEPDISEQSKPKSHQSESLQTGEVHISGSWPRYRSLLSPKKPIGCFGTIAGKAGSHESLGAFAPAWPALVILDADNKCLHAPAFFSYDRGLLIQTG